MFWLDRAGRFSPLKVAAFLALLLPAAWLAWRWGEATLGPRPYETVIRDTGDWAVRILLLSLAVTPLRQVLRAPRLALLRRMIGLFALTYALLHLALYAADQAFDLAKVASEIARRVYLAIGFVALLGLAALGITSTDAMVRRLTGPRWRALHRLAYPIGLLALIHFTLQSKANVTEPMLMAGLYAWLMLYRATEPRGAASLLGLAVAACVFTAALEFAWYALATGINPWRVLAANLDVGFGPRPAVWVLIAGMAAMALKLVRQDRRREMPMDRLGPFPGPHPSSPWLPGAGGKRKPKPRPRPH